MASFLVPDVSRAHFLALQEEVLRDFALAAIRAHREDIEAARAELTGRIDPFSGTPYRARVEADGTLVMWSVDPDGEDGDAEWDEKLEEYTNVTWRYRP